MAARAAIGMRRACTTSQWRRQQHGARLGGVRRTHGLSSGRVPPAHPAGRRTLEEWGPWPIVRVRTSEAAERRPRIIRPCCSRSTSATRTSRSGCSRPGPWRRPAGRRRTPRASADELELLLDGLLRLDDASFADVSAIACASVVPNLTTRRSRRSPPGASGRSSSRRAGTVPLAIRIGPPAGGRRRPARQRAGRGAAPRDAGRRRRLRDRHDARLRGGRRRVRRRRDRAGPRARPRGARRADGQAAADRAPDARPGDRPRHRQRDAVGHDLRLPGAGGRTARPGPARARRRGRRRAAPTSRRS